MLKILTLFCVRVIFIVKIIVKKRKLRNILNSKKELIKQYDNDMADKIMQRIDDISKIENLENLMELPGRHHLLEGDKKGYFACDLKQPYRLIYKPANNPLPKRADGSLIYSEVTEIEIIEIINYH